MGGKEKEGNHGNAMDRVSSVDLFQGDASRRFAQLRKELLLFGTSFGKTRLPESVFGPGARMVLFALTITSSGRQELKTDSAQALKASWRLQAYIQNRRVRHLRSG